MPEPTEQALVAVRSSATVRPTSWINAMDLVLGCSVLLLGAFAFASLPDGSVLRLVLVLPVLFFIPGFLLLEAVLGLARTGNHRLVRSVAAIGISPPLVGLLALATSILPGGFQPIPIVALVTVTGFALGGTAFVHRRAISSKASKATATAV